MNKNPIRILVLGATGMLGSTMLKYLSSNKNIVLAGTIRSERGKNYLPANLLTNLIVDIDVGNISSLNYLFDSFKPEVVINCIGVVKQLDEAYDPLIALPINSLLPHQLAHLCEKNRARLISFSTDCVFSGGKGLYIEDDFPDANDLYGRSKYLGEIANKSNVLTLRTSIIGHELNGARSLVNWFLAQNGSVKGYERVIFSGLPTVEVAKIVENFILPRPDLSGLYHLSGNPINKYDLLELVAKIYSKDVKIIRDESVRIDRSLNSLKFQSAVGFQPKPWPQLIKEMYQFH